MSTAASLRSCDAFGGVAIVMGVAGCGKSTVGAALAEALGARFIEGDLLHPAANIAKMASGVALTDNDRWPWLDAVGQASSAGNVDGRGAIASCSALKRTYRRRLIEAAGQPVAFVFLDGDRTLLEARLRQRPGHFMPASLLASQLAALEVPGADELAITVDFTWPVEAVVARAVAFMRSRR